MGTSIQSVSMGEEEKNLETSIQSVSTGEEGEEQKNLETSISNLDHTITEDGILSLITSLLPLREAVKTCVLTTRWRTIWIHRPILYFNAANMLDAHTASLVPPENGTLTEKEKFELLKEKLDQFIQSVDSVLQQHQGRARVNEFVVRYYIPKTHSDHVDGWVRFAVTSKAKRLSLQLFKPYFKAVEADPYVFPFHLLGSSCIETLALTCCSLKPPCKFDGLGHLKVLCLYYTNVTDDDINHLLPNCYNLESLTVWNSPQLVTLSIPHRLSRLQALYLKNCDQLRQVYINAPNVSKLCYWGTPVDFIVSPSSQLTDAKIYIRTEQKQHGYDFYLNKLSRSLPHLKSLAIIISGVTKVDDLPKVSNRFVNLTCLEWVWKFRVRMSLLFLGSLMDASPFLEELKLHLSARVVEQPLPRLSELKEMLPKHPRAHLKTIEIFGFYFDQWQIEIALYILINAAKLESMMIEKGPKPCGDICETDIMNLCQEIPTNVKLVVL